MRLQDIHAYDSFIVGIKNIYFVDYRGDFHINAPFILAANKTLSTGCTYVLIESFNRKKDIVRQVLLLDVYYSDGSIFLLVEDISSKETFTIDQQIECTGDHFKWVLIDFNYLVEELNTEIIKSYCGSCKNVKENSIANSNYRKLNNDLLEFDF